MEEAQQRMSYREFNSWVKFAMKHGTIDAGRRIETTLGFIAARFAGPYLTKIGGGNFTLSDFLPYADEVPDKEGTPEDVFNLLKSLTTKGDANG